MKTRTFRAFEGGGVEKTMYCNLEDFFLKISSHFLLKIFFQKVLNKIELFLSPSFIPSRQIKL